MIDLLQSVREHLRCTSCGESMDSEGNDPWELLLTSHYCPTDEAGGSLHH